MKKNYATILILFAFVAFTNAQTFNFNNSAENFAATGTASVVLNSTTTTYSMAAVKTNIYLQQNTVTNGGFALNSANYNYLKIVIKNNSKFTGMTIRNSANAVIGSLMTVSTGDTTFKTYYYTLSGSNWTGTLESWRVFFGVGSTLAGDSIEIDQLEFINVSITPTFNNFVQNPGFDDTPISYDGWKVPTNRPETNYSVTTTEKVTGSQSLKVNYISDAAAEPNAFIFIENLNTGTFGSPYNDTALLKASMRVKLKRTGLGNGIPKVVSVQSNFRVNGATNIPTATIDNSGALDTWELIEFQVGVPALTSVNSIIYRLNLIGAGFLAGDEIYIDDVAASIIYPTTTWNGSAWSNGAPDSNLEAIIDGTYTTSGNLTAKKLIVNSGKSFTITSGNNVTVTNGVINNGTMSIQNNANLVQTNNVTNTGNVTVNRNSSPLSRLDYTIWSSPVASQNLLNFSPATLPTRFYNYNTSTNLYNVVTDPSTTNFAVGSGNLIRMPDTAVLAPATDTFNGQLTGVLNNGNIPATLTYVDATRSFNMVGNPYPSVINAETFLTANTTNIENTLYFWRKTNGATGSAYATYTPGGATASTPGGIAPNGTIQVGQGFFVAAKSAATIPAFFTNTMRVANNANQFLKTTQGVERNRVWLNLTNNTGTFSQMLVGYMTDATQGVDALDGKYINDSPTALTSNINGEEYVIQARALPFDDSDMVALNFKTDVAGDYTITKDHADGLFATAQDIYLVDKITGTETNLQKEAYTFTTGAGVHNARFQLTYKTSKSLSVNDPAYDQNSILVYNQSGALLINAGKTTIINVKVFDITGKLILEQKEVNANKTSLQNLTSQKQILNIKITTQDNRVVTKKAIF